MKAQKEVRISYWAAHLTTVVSVTMVLLLIGIIAGVSLFASRETRQLKERIELSVIMADSVSDNAATQLAEKIASADYATSVKVVTKEQALKNWTADTGEDLEKLFGVNPLSPEITFNVSADHSSQQAIAKISRQLSAMPGVESVAAPDATMVDNMNRNIERLTLILGLIAIVMIVISFVLINNTVHLTIYSRRFTIHTMQLVGATNGFIRRPFVVNNLLSGVLAGAVASAILALCVALMPRLGIGDVRPEEIWPSMAVIAGGLIICGALICSLAALVATSRYLHKDYDELFK